MVVMKNIDAYRDTQTLDGDGNIIDEPTPADKRPITVVPMYIGALNNNMADTGMISFVRLFSAEAHFAYATQSEEKSK